MNFCPNCGAKIPHPGVDTFCMNCGTKLPQTAFEAPAPPTPEPVDPPAPAVDLFAGVPVMPQQPPVTPQPAYEPPQSEDLLQMIAQAQKDGPQDLFSAAESQLDEVFPPAPEQWDVPVPPAHFQPEAVEEPAAELWSAPVQPQPLDEPAPDLFAAAEDVPEEAAADLFEAEVADEVPSLFDAPAEKPAQPDFFSTAVIQTPSAYQKQHAPVQAEELHGHPHASGHTASHKPHGHHTAQSRAPQHLTREVSLADMAPPRNTNIPAPPPIPLPELEEPIRKTSFIGRFFAALGILILFLLITGCTIFVMLYFKNRPTKTVEAFAQAIQEVDTVKLQELTVLNGFPTKKLSTEEWQAFAAAFDQTASLNELKSQLLEIADEGKATDPAYPAVSIESKPFIWFIDRHYISIQSVEMLVPAAASGTTLRLGNKDFTGVSSENGELFSALMPGRYQCRVVPPGADPMSINPTEVEIFLVDTPNIFQSEITHADLTIQNCLSDDAIIYINDQPVADRPSGNVLTLQGVALGSTIRITAMQDGTQMESSVVFNDVNTTTLSFGEYTPVPGAQASTESQAESATPQLSAGEIDAALATFYPSYLECINNQNMDGIKLTTSAANDILGARIKKEGNAKNLFQFTSAQTDPASIKFSERDGVQVVQFNATFQYGYKAREGGTEFQSASNRQSVEMILVDGQWLVNNMIFVSDGDFNNHAIAAFS